MKIWVLIAMAGASMTVQAGHDEGADKKVHAMDGADIGGVQRSALTVLVYDYAGLPESATRNLEQRTGQIMSQVGIRLECPMQRLSRGSATGVVFGQDRARAHRTPRSGALSGGRVAARRRTGICTDAWHLCLYMRRPSP
jgi:hypothetical protein